MRSLVLFRRYTRDFLELVVEMGEVIKARFKAYLWNTQSIIDQQPTGIVHFDIVQKLRVGFVGVGFEIAAKGCFAHIRHGWDLFQGWIVGVIVDDELIDFIDALAFVFAHVFGKGSVQSVEYLPPGLGAIKTTVGMFFIPGGNSTQHRGVNGDIVFPSVLATDDIGEKTLDYSLPPKKIKEFVSKEAYVTDSLGAWKQVTPELIANLKKKSDARVTTSEGFKKISADFKKVQKRQKPMMISELLKDKNDKKKNVGKGDAAAAAKGADDESEDSDVGLSREERKKKYMERADVQEAMMIAADLAAEYSPTLTLGATKDASKPNKAAEPSTTPADSESEKTN